MKPPRHDRFIFLETSAHQSSKQEITIKHLLSLFVFNHGRLIGTCQRINGTDEHLCHAMSFIFHTKWATGNPETFLLWQFRVQMCAYIFSVNLCHFHFLTQMKACVLSDLKEYGRPQRCLKCTRGVGHARPSVPLTHTLKCFFIRKSLQCANFVQRTRQFAAQMKQLS